MSERLFSVISPVYNVARYLDDYFASLEAQTIGVERLEIILVDDGSTDESLAMCREFATRHQANVHVLHQANAGQAAARNAGLALATSPWVTFPDPDDALSDNYFADIDEFMRRPRSRDTALFASHLINWYESTGKLSDTHPTSFRFKIGSSTTNLLGKPNFIHGSAPISFFRRDIIAEHALIFPEQLRTKFEDTKFLFDYLLSVDQPILGLVDSARYHYRRRADNSSTLQTSTVDPRSYTDVPVHGFLPLLRRAQELHGEVPRWLQWFLIYDLAWWLRADIARNAVTRALPSDVLETFQRSMTEVMTYIEPDSVRAFDMMDTPQWMREAMAHGFSAEPYVGPVHISAVDESRGLVQLRYRYTGDAPSETIHVRGSEVPPYIAKTRRIELLGTTLLRERTLWTSSQGVLRLDLNGRMQPLALWETHASEFKARTSEHEAVAQRTRNRVPKKFRQIDERLSTRVTAQLKARVLAIRRAFRKQTLEDRLLVGLLRFPLVRRAYAGAWVLMDRDTAADDNAEHLYRWIRENKPHIKMRFVIRRETPDWRRLKDDGFRLVDYGSYRWKLLMLLAGHLLSSHADHYVVSPLPAHRYGPPQWKFTFLQHGITKGDLSGWLNAKSIDLFVCGTEAEYGYITGDSPYKFSRKEVRLTGFPRHDTLLAKGRAITGEDVNQILIAPTWRESLAGTTLAGGSTRELNQEFMSSDYATSWQAVLRSEALRDFAESSGLQVVFMPHPNIQPYLSQFEIPAWVQTRRYGEMDIQDVLCRSAVMITDYSSLAFDMAYLERPVVYFQFDHDHYRAGHTEGEGYFSYGEDGFGPVASDVGDVVKALDSLWSTPDVAATYAERARQTFPVCDGKNSARVFRAVTDLDRPLTFKQASQPAPADTLS